MPAVVVLALGAIPAAALAKEQRPNKLEEQYQSEKDPVRKARLLAKLGPIKIGRAHAYLLANDQEQAFSTLEHYRDDVRETAQSLEAAVANVRKHPEGFKELQIGLRESIRRIDDIIFSLPLDDRTRLEAVRSDLYAAQTSLFEDLFPTTAERGGKKK
jgi:hypothetical protein